MQNGNDVDRLFLISNIVPLISSCGVGSRDRIVVSTLRCGRNNPGSNPGHGIHEIFFLSSSFFLFFLFFFFFVTEKIY